MHTLFPVFTAKNWRFPCEEDYFPFMSKIQKTGNLCVHDTILWVQYPNCTICSWTRIIKNLTAITSVINMNRNTISVLLWNTSTNSEPPAGAMAAEVDPNLSRPSRPADRFFSERMDRGWKYDDDEVCLERSHLPHSTYSTLRQAPRSQHPLKLAANIAILVLPLSKYSLQQRIRWWQGMLVATNVIYSLASSVSSAKIEIVFYGLEKIVVSVLVAKMWNMDSSRQHQGCKKRSSFTAFFTRTRSPHRGFYIAKVPVPVYRLFLTVLGFGTFTIH